MQTARRLTTGPVKQREPAVSQTMTMLYLFALQEDKDLVHEFVQNDGLACLIKVGSEADQNYQNYILRGE
jgi:hypothetical protein